MIRVISKPRVALSLGFIAMVLFLAWALTPYQRYGQFRIAHHAPIYQGITRMAFLHESPNGLSLYFSTLESYHKNPTGDRVFLITHELGSRNTSTTTISRSIEVRSFAHSKTLRRYVLGTSLDPQLFSFDPASRRLKRIFSGQPSDGFIHSLAIGNAHAYTILSHDERKRGAGILKIDIATGKAETIPFTDTMPQGWGGVQAVDPTGRVWFYRAYPLQEMWYDTLAGMRSRTLPGHQGWSIESWDTWNGRTYILLTNPQGRFIKRPIDLASLNEIAAPTSLLPSDIRLFLESIRLDLYHGGSPALDNIYFHPNTSSLYRMNSSNDKMTLIGKVELGQFQVMGFSRVPQESPTRWIHPTLGEIEALGITRSNHLIIWLRGRNIYGTVDLKNKTLTLKEVPAPSLSPADITALAPGPDGFLYGAGILTMAHIFKFDPATNTAQLLKGAIPNSEGQINTMMAGWDGKIYGVGYPDAVIFRFDTSAPWNPGTTPGSNPLNLGPMGHHHQMRASNGVQDLDGAVWYQSVTDYSLPIAHALAKADFTNRTFTVKTDLDDGFPQIRDLAVFDREHLLLLGQSKGRSALFVLNQRDFKIERMRVLSDFGGVLVNLDPQASPSRLFLAQGRTLYRVQRDLTLTPMHRSAGSILKVLAGSASDVILLGQRHIEKVDLWSGKTEMWWDGRPWKIGRNKREKPGGYVYRHTSWKPAVFRQGVLQIADEEKIWSFYPPPAN